ncbi:MAG: S41 family peptidase [Blastocatellia bacterium]
MTREQFESDIATLDAAIPSLQDHQIIVRMLQITARIGDGHTYVHLPASFKRYPLQLYWFGNELRVTHAAADYETALGARVVKIGEMSVDAVQARILGLLSQAENEWFIKNNSPKLMVRPEVLQALGIVPTVERAPFTFEDEQGKQFTLELKPISVLPDAGGVSRLSLRPAVKEEPLYRQRPAEPFWVTYLPDSQTVYANFRSYNGLGENAKKLFELIDHQPTKKLVIDMRQNGGGDFTKVRRDLIPGIKQRAAINKPGHLFVIIGRATFSAAMSNAADFKKDTRAILVGEPTGERPNSYQENDEMKLPNSGIVVSYSTRYYKFLDEDAPAVMPDKRLDPEWPAYRAGRDPVMEWILAYPAD